MVVDGWYVILAAAWLKRARGVLAFLSGLIPRSLTSVSPAFYLSSKRSTEADTLIRTSLSTLVAEPGAAGGDRYPVRALGSLSCIASLQPWQPRLRPLPLLRSSGRHP